jgi:hypothetical protein
VTVQGHARTQYRRAIEHKNLIGAEMALRETGAIDLLEASSLRDVPLSLLRRATGLSLRYVSLIRRGERTPHPTHWQAFMGVAALPE